MIRDLSKMYPQTRHPVSGGGSPAGSAPTRAPRSCSHFLIVVRRAAAAPGRGWLLRVALARCAAVPAPAPRPRGYGQCGGSERVTPPPAAAPHRQRHRRGRRPGRFGHRAAASGRAGVREAARAAAAGGGWRPGGGSRGWARGGDLKTRCCLLAGSSPASAAL